MISSDNRRQGYGRGHFVLGYGPTGVFGHIEVFVQVIAPESESVLEWTINEDIAHEAQQRIERAAHKFFHMYLTIHSGVRLCVKITQLRSDTERKNDYERAFRLALYDALKTLSLPVPQLYMAPADDETWSQEQ